MCPTSRRLAVLCAVGVLSCASTRGATPSSSADTPLRDLGDAAGLRIGAAVAWEPLQKDPTYAALVGRHFHVLTPEHDLKWAPIEHEQGRRDTRNIEDIAAVAARHGQDLRGHTLVWDLEVPGWVDTTDPQALDRALMAHLRATVRENLDRVTVWDVVNESLAADGSRKASVLHTQLGPGHLGAAFQVARAEAPDARLFYNDYAVLWPGPKADGLVRLVDTLLAAGVPIDGVGLQSHLHLVSEGRLDWPGIRQNLRRLGQRGLELHLSEVDVRVADLAGGQSGRLMAQAQAVYALVDACRDEPACTTVSFWGVTDRYSWVDRTIGPDDPLLWDEAGQPKPAFFAVQDALMGQPWRGCRQSLVDGDVGRGLGSVTVGGGRARVEAGADGDGRLVLDQRTESWHGPRLDVSEVVSEGLDYRFSAEVRVRKGRPLRSTLRIEDAAGTRFVSLAEATSTGSWQDLSATTALDLQAPVNRIEWYVEGPPAGSRLEVASLDLRVACSPASVPHKR